MEPLSSFASTKSLSSNCSSASSTERDPLSLFQDRSTDCNFWQSPKLEGISPSSELFHKNKSSRFESFPSSIGIFPVKRFLSSWSPTIMLQLRSSTGIVPERKLALRNNLDMVASVPRLAEMLPKK
ncbi:hypothetical protein KP509_02G082500 [Ceratopteris richardii]|uniref:Uncharacterized protein n=1 Tax=Ceratopteris richardii TaxID=49495 RepID=A0A8T2V7S0_CERRI|nr:hypothetical protein KP509_02G082500 [Ceratopteris richardii]